MIAAGWFLENAWLIPLIPGIASLLVEVDPLADLDAVAAYVRECAEGIQTVSETRGRAPWRRLR